MPARGTETDLQGEGDTEVKIWGSVCAARAVGSGGARSSEGTEASTAPSPPGPAQEAGGGERWLLELQQHQSLEGSPWVSAAPPPAQATGPTRSSTGRGRGLPASAGFLRPLLVGSGDLGQLQAKFWTVPHIHWFYKHMVTHYMPGLL